jgi:7-carboxy-7-deazaguanine synthase (Cx14CxxC type)
MKYAVKELYYTLQGEGINVGRPAVFLRFAGCNLWSGLEKDRGKAICQFCDTDFVGTDGPGGGLFTTAQALASAVANQWPTNGSRPVRRLVVCTGGEPLLQLDASLIEAIHQEGFEVAVETNGTQAAPPGLDWICVSPKAGTELKLTTGDELKFVYPQIGADPIDYEELAFTHFLLQPMDGPDVGRNTQAAVDFCRTHPTWRLSLQTHKLLRIP